MPPQNTTQTAALPVLIPSPSTLTRSPMMAELKLSMTLLPSRNPVQIHLLTPQMLLRLKPTLLQIKGI